MLSHARPLALPLFWFAASSFFSPIWRLRKARHSEQNVVLLRGLVLGIIEVAAQLSGYGRFANPRRELPVRSNAAHPSR